MRYEDQQCINCGVWFGVPEGFTNYRRRDKRTFWCPNGHTMSYTESEADQLRRERDRLRQRIAEKDDAIAAANRVAERANERADQARRQVSAVRGVVTRLRNRAAAGVCPCCSRSFENLKRHMDTKHKGFVGEPIEGADQ